MTMKLIWHLRVHFVQRLLLILRLEHLLGFLECTQSEFNICLILYMH